MPPKVYFDKQLLDDIYGKRPGDTRTTADEIRRPTPPPKQEELDRSWHDPPRGLVGSKATTDSSLSTQPLQASYKGKGVMANNTGNGDVNDSTLEAEDKVGHGGDVIDSTPEAEDEVGHGEPPNKKRKKASAKTTAGQVSKQKRDITVRIFDNAIALAMGEKVRPFKADIEHDTNMIYYAIVRMQVQASKSRNSKTAPTPNPLTKTKARNPKLDYSTVQPQALQQLRTSPNNYHNDLSSFLGPPVDGEDDDEEEAVEQKEEGKGDVPPPPGAVTAEVDRLRKELDSREKELNSRTKELFDAKQETQRVETKNRLLEKFKSDNRKVYEDWTKGIEKQRADVAHRRAKAREDYAAMKKAFEEEMRATEEMEESLAFAMDGASDSVSRTRDVNAIYADLIRAKIATVLCDIEQTQVEVQDLNNLEIFASRYASDFREWKMRKAADVWRDIRAAEDKLEELQDEYDFLCGEDPNDADYVHDAETSSDDFEDGTVEEDSD